MDFYNKTKQFVIDIFTKAGDLTGIKHHERTDYWVAQLKPNADEALKTAAISHDIERGIYGDWKASSMDAEKLRKHQDMSASIVEEFLKKVGAEDKFIQKVRHFILKHEYGGDDDQNILCDADRLTYFENVAVRHAKNYKNKGKTKKEMRDKLDFEFNKIHSIKAKEIARIWYDEALNELEK
jgi:hypothetical protein